MIKNNKGFTLIETLLSLTLIMLFMGVSIAFTSVTLINNTKIETNVEDYATLNRYMRCNAELLGKKTELLISSNKLEAVIEEFDGSTKDIQSLQPKLEDLNENTTFECVTPMIVTHLPNGEVEYSQQVTMIFGDDTNKVALVNVANFNNVSVLYTNQPSIDNNIDVDDGSDDSMVSDRL